MQNPKVSVIGAGDWGKNLIRNFAFLEALDSVCDHNAEHGNRVASQHEVSNKCWDDILQNPGVSAVVIATQAHTHSQLAKEALDANKHVFVEKPMTLTYADAMELRDHAKLRNKVVMVGHLLQYHPGFLKIKQLVNDGELGKLRYIYSNRLHLGKIYPNQDVAWDLAPHDLSMILGLTSSEPIDIQYLNDKSSASEVANFSLIKMQFPEGIAAHTFVSWMHPIKEQKLVVVGSKAMAVFEDTQDWNRKISIYRHKIYEDGKDITVEKSEAEYIKISPEEPLKNECQHFLDCIANNVTPLTDAEESCRILKILDRSKPFY